MSDLTVNELAEEINVSRQTAEKLVKAGAVRSYKLSPRTTRIPRSELERIRQRR